MSTFWSQSAPGYYPNEIPILSTFYCTSLVLWTLELSMWDYTITQSAKLYHQPNSWCHFPTLTVDTLHRKQLLYIRVTALTKC